MYATARDTGGGVAYAHAVARLRHHLVHHRLLTSGLIALALLMRIAIPAGYMPAFAGGAMTVTLCSGDGPMPMAGMAGHGTTADHGKTSDHGKTDMPCGFSALAAASLAATDPLVVAVAIAFIVATSRRPVITRHVGLPAGLRPPLRGPPATA